MSPEVAIEEIGPGELIRTLDRFGAGLEKVNEKLDKLTESFVTRELHETQMTALETKLKDHGVWLADVAASLERTRSTYVPTATARWVVGVLATIVVGLACALLTLVPS